MRLRRKCVTELHSPALQESRPRCRATWLVQIVHAGKTESVWPEQPWPERTHHATSENGSANTTTILQLTIALDDVLNLGKEGQAWIFLWKMTTLTAMTATFLSRRALLLPAAQRVLFEARKSGSLPQLQELHPGASERHFCPLTSRQNRLRRVRRYGPWQKSQTMTDENDTPPHPDADYDAGLRERHPKWPVASHLSVSLCCLTCRLSRVSCPCCFSTSSMS